MAKISATKKLILEDFAEQRPWIDKLVQPVNAFFEQVYFALVGGLTISDNLKAQKWDYTLGLGQDYTQAVKLQWNRNEKPTAVIIGYIREISGAPASIGNHSLEWYFNDGNIEVKFNGLVNTKKYLVRIVGLV